MRVGGTGRRIRAEFIHFDALNLLRAGCTAASTRSAKAKKNRAI